MDDVERLLRRLALNDEESVGMVLANGPDAATAVMRAVLLARACQVQLQAMAAGQIQLWSDSAELALKKRQVWPESQINAGYAYLCRQAG